MMVKSTLTKHHGVIQLVLARIFAETNPIIDGRTTLGIQRLFQVRYGTMAMKLLRTTHW